MAYSDYAVDYTAALADNYVTTEFPIVNNNIGYIHPDGMFFPNDLEVSLRQVADGQWITMHFNSPPNNNMVMLSPPDEEHTFKSNEMAYSYLVFLLSDITIYNRVRVKARLCGVPASSKIVTNANTIVTDKSDLALWLTAGNYHDAGVAATDAAYVGLEAGEAIVRVLTDIKDELGRLAPEQLSVTEEEIIATQLEVSDHETRIASLEANVTAGGGVVTATDQAMFTFNQMTSNSNSGQYLPNVDVTYTNFDIWVNDYDNGYAEGDITFQIFKDNSPIAVGATDVANMVLPAGTPSKVAVAFETPLSFTNANFLRLTANSSSSTPVTVHIRLNP